MNEGIRYQPSQRGVDFMSLNAGDKEKGQVIGSSGRPLEYILRSNLISIYDKKYPLFQLQADTSNGNFYLCIKTRANSEAFPFLVNDRHPDLYAADFVRFAYDYLLKNGNEIQKCKSVWGIDSDNYMQYKHYVRFMSPQEAAKLTWSGKIFSSLGFPNVDADDIEVRSISRDEEIISVSFAK